MKKIVILGCENSHADSFLEFIYNNEKFQGIEVVGIYSDESEPMQRLAEKFHVPIMQSYDEAVGKVDGVVITARHGDKHFLYAEPYLQSGVPMFIDKPITISATEAVEFAKRLREKQIQISGGTICKHDRFVQQLKEEHEKEVDGETLGGFVRAPLMEGSVYGGFYFYAQHLVEVVLEIFGRHPYSVQAYKNGRTVNVLFKYDGFSINGLYVNKSNLYFACRQSQSGMKAQSIYTTESVRCSELEFAEFYDVLFGGQSKISYDDFIAPVFVMNAIERSMESGKEEKIAYQSMDE